MMKLLLVLSILCVGIVGCEIKFADPAPPEAKPPLDLYVDESPMKSNAATTLEVCIDDIYKWQQAFPELPPYDITIKLPAGTYFQTISDGVIHTGLHEGVWEWDGETWWNVPALAKGCPGCKILWEKRRKEIMKCNDCGCVITDRQYYEVSFYNRFGDLVWKHRQCSGCYTKDHK